MVTKADKGVSAVMTEVKDYIREAECQLKSKDNYDKLKYDSTEKENRLVNGSTQKFKKQKFKKLLKD